MQQFDGFLKTFLTKICTLLRVVQGFIVRMFLIERHFYK